MKNLIIIIIAAWAITLIWWTTKPKPPSRKHTIYDDPEAMYELEYKKGVR